MKRPLLAAAAVGILSRGVFPAPVEQIATPEGGIQPRALAAADGTLHLVWYQGDARGGNVWHARRPPGREFSRAARVNSEPDTAVAAGTIRGAQAALGKGGRVHVVWNGPTRRKNDRPPLFHARMTDDGRTFEPQRAVSGDWIMDGGGAVAADAAGNVHVFYHGGQAGDPHGRSGESFRRVLVRTSGDEGRTFGPERILSPEGEGVCACCAMQAISTDGGTVIALYRTATDAGRRRDIASLVSRDGGRTFAHSIVDRWAIPACPMSSMSLAATPQGVVGAWEREGQIYLAPITGGKPAALFSPGGGPSQRKHPTLAARGGDLLVAWTEGTGWQQGGSMAWQVLDAATLAPTRTAGSAPGVAVWSFVSAAPVRDGFVIVR